MKPRKRLTQKMVIDGETKIPNMFIPISPVDAHMVAVVFREWQREYMSDIQVTKVEYRNGVIINDD